MNYLNNFHHDKTILSMPPETLTITNAHTHHRAEPWWDPQRQGTTIIHYESHYLPGLTEVAALMQREGHHDLKHFSALGFYPQLVRSDVSFNQQCWERLSPLLDQYLWIGETGIDLRFKETLDQQLLVFSWHLKLAQKFNKGIVIHQVKGLQHTLNLIIKLNFTGPVLWHHLKPQQVPQIHQILTAQDKDQLFHQQLFSFGPTVILNINSDEKKMFFRKLWEDHQTQILLETDDLPGELLLDMLYELSNLLGLPVEVIAQQIAHNFLRHLKPSSTLMK